MNVIDIVSAVWVVGAVAYTAVVGYWVWRAGRARRALDNVRAQAAQVTCTCDSPLQSYRPH